MTQGTQKQKSPAWFKTLAEIVISSRRRAGARELGEDDLKREVAEWSAVCEPIPEERLTECYFRALRERTVRAALQPGELYQLSTSIAQEQRNSRPAPTFVENGEACWYCEGTGWQTLARKVPDSYGENTFVRPCACSAAPLEIRKLEPLGEPEWHKRKHSVIWERSE